MYFLIYSCCKTKYQFETNPYLSWTWWRNSDSVNRPPSFSRHFPRPNWNFGIKSGFADSFHSRQKGHHSQVASTWLDHQENSSYTNRLKIHTALLSQFNPLLPVNKLLDFFSLVPTDFRENFKSGLVDVQIFGLVH